MYKILIVKSYYVSLVETEDAINYFSLHYPDAYISLVANLFPDEYQYVVKNINVTEKILYGPQATKLTGFQLVKLFFSLHRKKIDQAFVLIGKVSSYDYLKGKLLAFFSGAKQAKLYYVATKQETTLDLFGIQGYRNKISKILFVTVKGILNLIGGTFILITITVLFTLFIVLPMKVKKILSR